METEELLKIAKNEVDCAQNESWRADEQNPFNDAFAKMLFLDAGVRALIAIAQELKRANGITIRHSYN